MDSFFCLLEARETYVKNKQRHRQKKTSERKKERERNIQVSRLNEICNIHGHFIDLRGIELFDISQDANIVVFNEILTKEGFFVFPHENFSLTDRNTFASKTTWTTNSMNVQFTGIGKIIVDH